jgi:uncharacterized protein (TIGR03118 family)
MKNKFLVAKLRTLMPIAAIAVLSSCHKPDVPHPALRNFEQVNLVANKAKYLPKTIDPTLINGFGMSWSPNGAAWVNSVGGHVSEIYTADGTIARTPVNIPSPADTINGLPTGVVFAGGLGFQIPGGSAAFLFSGFDGVISGWNGASINTAKRLKNPPGAAYTGIAISNHSNQNFVYAANFAGNKIDVWDTNFVRVNMPFADPEIPAGFAPYNIQSVNKVLFVLYAERGANGLPVAGKGKGYVNIFAADGRLIKRLASEGALNVPWGVALSPSNFLQGDDLGVHGLNYEGENNPYKEPVLLIGNFGDGRINVYGTDGLFLGQLSAKNKPIVIDGLWALSFAPATASIDPMRLYFTAGPEKETDGLFGYVIKK